MKNTHMFRRLLTRFIMGSLLLVHASVWGQDLRIDPPHWYAGMAQDTLQLMIHGRGLGKARLAPQTDTEMNAFPTVICEL